MDLIWFYKSNKSERNMYLTLWTSWHILIVYVNNFVAQARRRNEVTSACTNGDHLAVSVCLDRREGMDPLSAFLSNLVKLYLFAQTIYNNNLRLIMVKTNRSTLHTV